MVSSLAATDNAKEKIKDLLHHDPKDVRIALEAGEKAASKGAKDLGRVDLADTKLLSPTTTPDGKSNLEKITR